MFVSERIYSVAKSAVSLITDQLQCLKCCSGWPVGHLGVILILSREQDEVWHWAPRYILACFPSPSAVEAVCSILMLPVGEMYFSRNLYSQVFPVLGVLVGRSVSRSGWASSRVGDDGRHSEVPTTTARLRPPEGSFLTNCS